MASEPVEIPISAPGADKAEKDIKKVAGALGDIDKAGKAAAKALGDVDKTSLRSVGESLFTTANQAVELAGKALSAAQGLAHLASQAEDSQRALTALGPAAAQVEAATQGMVTASEAFQFQQGLVRSGLRVSNEELAVLTRGAREHARAMGTDTAQALGQLGDALRGGSAEGLRAFGVAVAQGTTRGRAMGNTLRTLARQQRDSAPAARTLAEDSTRLGTSITEATGAIASMIAQGVGLQGFLSSAANGFSRLAREVSDYVDTERRRPAVQEAEQRRMRSLETYTNTIRELRREATRLGVELPQFANAGQVSDQARDALATRARTLLTSLRQGAQQQGRVASDLSGLGLGVERRGVVRFDPTTGREVIQSNRPGELSGRDFGVFAAQARGVRGRSVSAANLVAPSSDDARRAAIEAFGRDIQNESVTRVREEDRRRAEAAAARARAARPGPRDSLGVGVQIDSASALRQAQMELAVANQSLSVMDVRFQRLGQVMSREEELHQLRQNASRTEREGNELESARLSRVAQARTALLQALTEERDRRQQLREITQSEDAGAAQGALGALGTARSGGRLTATAEGQLAAFNQIFQRLVGVTNQQRAQASELQAQLSQANVPLTEQIRLRQQLVGLQGTIAANEQTLLQMEERDRDNRRARVELLQSEVSAHGTLYEAAISARDAHLQLTRSESEAMNNRQRLLQQLTTLEQGYRQLISQTDQELAAARTEEQRNAAITRRIQLLGQLSAVETQRRGMERTESQENDRRLADFRQFIGAQENSVKDFSAAASSAYGQFTDAFAGALAAVVKGESSFEEAMAGMLKSVLESISKMAFVEALKNIALGIGHLAIQAYPAAALNFAAAAAWGAVGVATGVASAAIPSPSAKDKKDKTDTTSKPATTDRPASAGGQGQGGGLVLNIRVDGALMNEGVEQNIVRAIDRAGIRNVTPRRM